LSFARQKGAIVGSGARTYAIRSAKKEDLNDVIGIINATNRVFYKAIVPKERFRDPFLRLEDFVEEFKRKAFYLFEVDGEPVGVAAFTARACGAAIMDRLYVLPDFQGQGVGSALLSYAETLARQRGLSKILVWTDPKATWAVSFYKRLGYCEVDPKMRFGDPLIDSRIAQHPRELLVLHKRLAGKKEGG
jgi:GNAT superfamily N-acetyltransferase